MVRSFHSDSVRRMRCSMTPTALAVRRSGWVEDEKVKGLLEYTGQPFLQKPVDFGELVRVVREAVDRADAALEPVYLSVD